MEPMALRNRTHMRTVHRRDHRIGTVPLTVVPPCGELETSNEPPMAASLSAIPCRPVPYDVDDVSNPRPSSLTENRSTPEPLESRTVAVFAFAYLATFWSASKHEK